MLERLQSKEGSTTTRRLGNADEPTTIGECKQKKDPEELTVTVPQGLLRDLVSISLEAD